MLLEQVESPCWGDSVQDQDIRAIVVRGYLHELGFRRISVRDYSSRGTPFFRSIAVGMPKIPAMIRNAAFYLYPTKEDAKHGTNFGGTGFLIGVPSKRHAKYGRAHIYAVSNWHVAVQGSPIIRLNMQSGPPDIIDVDVHDWFFDGRHDIAVLPVNVDPDLHAVTVLHSRMLVTQDVVRRAEIGPGDDVFMVGRFMDHDGGQKNQPALRFGNISMNPTPIMQDNGVKADAYSIDLHSRSGYSGSPVFVYRTPQADLEPPAMQRTATLGAPFQPETTTFFMLLGIHFAQFPELWEVTSAGKLRHESESKEPLLTESKYIKGLSGMTCVLPAWTIREVLNMPTLSKMREQSEADTEARFQREGYPPEPEDKRFADGDPNNDTPTSEAASSSASDANPNHLADFTRLVDVAARKRPQGDQT
jgi:hypothetical protein